MSGFEGPTVAARADEILRAVTRATPGLRVDAKFDRAREVAHLSAESRAVDGRWDEVALDLLAAAVLKDRAVKARQP